MSRGTWIKLTSRSKHEAIYLNMELAEGIRQVNSISGEHLETRISFQGNEDAFYAVKETPEQIFEALHKDARYPWASLPGAVFTPGSIPT